MNCLCLVAFLAIVIAQSYSVLGVEAASSDGFVSRKGIQFILNGKPFYANGFNAYWLGYEATDPATRFKITYALQNATTNGLTIARTWGFRDGGYRALQITPGSYDELTFQTMVNRVNTFTKIAYKDEAAIMAWELMNEPQCKADPSGKTLTAWISEMAPYVKSLDSNHLLGTGLEGFYGDSSPERKTSLNPVAANVLGTDFIANHNIDAIDFASIHAYPDLWFPNLNETGRLDYLSYWIEGHMEDAESILKKPLILGEFGKPTETPGYTQAQRDAVFVVTFETIYESAAKGGPAAGALFWHLISDGMNNFKDGLAIVLSDKSSTNSIIGQQSRKLRLIGGGKGKLSRKIKN
ncbi:unnamed protein product [Microthlaspi erraticum]|uniref:mannan endo-1,4-beta-mannosidase n=1 Tax=Microthlaspi erraticum TaxID=1685480 RepID=A0A6D2JY77_9BRAS|nr:unnamed protein product [Microthlaspi erraticum]